MFRRWSEVSALMYCISEAELSFCFRIASCACPLLGINIGHGFEWYYWTKVFVTNFMILGKFQTGTAIPMQSSSVELHWNFSQHAIFSRKWSDFLQRFNGDTDWFTMDFSIDSVQQNWVFTNSMLINKAGTEQFHTGIFAGPDQFHTGTWSFSEELLF